MRQITKVLVAVTLILGMSLSYVNAQNVEVKDSANQSEQQMGLFDWEKVIDAVIIVESGGNPRAVGGSSVGVLQITPVCVRECNNILKSRGSKKRYALKDRYSVEKSKEMFYIIQKRYNPENNIEKGIRMWNGGPFGWKSKATLNYYRKVIKLMK